MCIITGITASRRHSCVMSAKQFDVLNFEYKIHQSLLSFICSSSFLLSDALEDRCTLCSLSNRTDIHIQDTNIVVQFRSIGRLTTIDMNRPLLSKYWCFVKILQGLQAPVRSPQLWVRVLRLIPITCDVERGSRSRIRPCTPRELQL